MRKIILSLFIIVGASSAIAVGSTGAFFADTESSTGNTFAAGAIDLKIDNDSYYNGNRCSFIEATTTPGFYWQGPSAYPVPGTSCETSFPLADLDDGFVFFNFDDLKPDDEGEDTISIHVQNDAYACMDLTLTSNDDTSSNEPELATGDTQEDAGDAWDGELADALAFFWWADDGDNVYEVGEALISDGVQSLDELAPQGGSFSVTLADSQTNAWDPTDETPAPLPANETVYIAKAWCMGTLTPAPLAQDGIGTDGPQSPGREGGGFTCDGTALGNETQTDGVELNVVFSAVQARNNPDFLCTPPDNETQTVTLTVNKIITADTVGIGVEDFELHILGPGGDQIVSDNVPVPGLPAGNYTVSEVILPAGLPPGVTFTATFGGACAVDGTVTLAPGDNLVCTLTNVENEPESVLSDGFGTGSSDSSFNEAPTWEEGGAGSDKRAVGTGDETASTGNGDGGRKAAMMGTNGYICKSINAAGFTGLNLAYAWRGDTQAEAGDNGLVQYATGGTCAAPTGLTTVATHPLTTTTWQDNSVSLSAVDNTTFLLFFRAASNFADEDFRVDGVSLTGF